MDNSRQYFLALGLSLSITDTQILPIIHRRRQKHTSLLALAAGPLGIIKNTTKRKITYIPSSFSIENYDDNWCVEFLRFDRTQIIILAEALNIPTKFRNRYRASSTTALALVLFRLAWPSRNKELLHYFGHAYAWLSIVFNDVCIFLYETYKDHLFWDSSRLTERVFTSYCRAIYIHGEPSGKIWGFIDGTHRPFCRPGPTTADQQLFYSGYKKAHTMVWQAVVTPDGLISSLSGPWEGRHGDWGILGLSGIQDKLYVYAFDDNADRVYIYGDAAYYLESGIMGAYRAGINVPLTEEERGFNTAMSNMRVTVEWGFGKVINMFGFCGYKNELKLGLSPIAAYYFVACLLTNCHTCFNGSVTGEVFQCSPPDIWEYLGLDEPNENI